MRLRSGTELLRFVRLLEGAMIRSTRLLLCSAAVLTAASLMACSSGKPTPPPPIAPGEGNYEALAFAAAAHMGELEENRLALTAAQAPAVRAFAQQMVRDHSLALQRAQTIGTQLGMTLTVPESATKGAFPAADIGPAATNWSFPATILGKNQEVLAKSRWGAQVIENHKAAIPALITYMTAGGTQFDREFINRQVNVHRYVLEGLDALLPAVPDQNLRAALAGDRTSVASHLRMAEQLQKAQ
jgi:predicted outer membrane protein